ncbi:MAG: transcription repressor NadR [Bacillota bacterium]
MEARERRKLILQLLGTSEEPLTGTELARRMSVSRQVIVQDMAVLRASGEQILATPQGYMMVPPAAARGKTRNFAVCHDRQRLEEELLLIIDRGGEVLDVAVEHPVYGELKGLLMLSSRQDVADFLSRLGQTGAEPLLALTGGTHIHTVQARSEQVLDEIQAALKRAGLLLEDN